MELVRTHRSSNKKKAFVVISYISYIRRNSNWGGKMAAWKHWIDHCLLQETPENKIWEVRAWKWFCVNNRKGRKQRNKVNQQYENRSMNIYGIIYRLGGTPQQAMVSFLRQIIWCMCVGTYAWLWGDRIDLFKSSILCTHLRTVHSQEKNRLIMRSLWENNK